MTDSDRVKEFKLPNVKVSCSFGDEELGFFVTKEEIIDGLLDRKIADGLEVLRRAVAVRSL